MLQSNENYKKLWWRYILEVDVEYPKNLLNKHSDLPILSKRMKINKYNKLVCNLSDKKSMLFI